MKKSRWPLVVGTLILGALAIWALWGSVAWTLPEVFLAGFALLAIGLAITV